MKSTDHTFIRMSGLVSVAITTLFAGQLGCDQSADAPEVRSAFERLASALRAADATALWELTDTETQTALVATADRVMAAAPLVEEMWGDLRGADASRAMEAIAFSTFELGGAMDEGRGPRLVAAFVDFGKLQWTEGSAEALQHPTIVLDDSTPLRAIVRVPSGESFVFEKEGDRWTSTLVRLATIEAPLFKGLMANLDKLSAYRDERDRAWRVSVDAQTPQGAYNLVRQAIANEAEGPSAIFHSLDSQTRDMFRLALELGRKTQRRIQQRTPRAQRALAYEETGIELTVEAKSDQALFVAWYKANAFDPAIAKDPPVSFVYDDNDAKKAGHILTESGRKWTLTKREDGFWATTMLREAVETKLLKPLEAAEEQPAK